MARKTVDSKTTAPAAPQVNTENRVQLPRFVVLREGHRVSPNEYVNPDDSKALEEQKYWQRIAKKHSWGEPVEIVEYDNKYHRVW